MSNYTGKSRPRDRASAIAAVVAVHVILAAVILSGLDVAKVREVVDSLQTFDVREVAPPPPRPAPKPPKPAAAAAGRPAPKAEAAPVIAPPPRVPAPSPIPAAKIAGNGTAASSGAASSGNGTGAAGNETATGGGGNGAGFTPAQLVRNIPSSEYRQLASTGLPSGLVGVTIRVDPDGGVSNCRIARSSGDARLDAIVCELTLRYVRFAPARDPQGRPIAQDVTYFPNWRHR